MTDSVWPVPVRLHELAGGPVHRQLEADGAARLRVARLLNLERLDALRAEVDVAPWIDGAVVSARWTAELTQLCSVTAEDFASALDGSFEVRCVPPGSPLAPQSDAELSLDPEAEDPPDVLDGEVIDLGAYVVEHLALELDPFPRAPGAAFEPPATEAEPSPFAVLTQLKR